MTEGLIHRRGPVKAGPSPESITTSYAMITVGTLTLSDDCATLCTSVTEHQHLGSLPPVLEPPEGAPRGL